MIFSLHMSWIRYWSLPDYCDRYMLISNTHCRWHIFPALFFNAWFSPVCFSMPDFPSVWFFSVGFSCVVFLDAHFIAVGKSQTKVRRIFSHRMESVGRIIFQCPIGNAIIGSANVLTLTLLMPGCCCSITFFQKCWHVIFYVKGIDALFSSPDF